MKKKPRREFRAFLIDALLRSGANLPPDPSYKAIATEIERVWLQRRARRA